MTAARAGDSAVVRLPRGGTIVMTSAGSVQFGAPPETLKDALSAGLEVPAIYVLPATWFSRQRGLTIAELEFPTYYNHFVLARRLTAVCDGDGRRRLLAVLRESLLGPERVDAALDYSDLVLPGARADLVREMDWFRRKGGQLERPMVLDDVIDFALYDSGGRARLGEKVEIQRVHGDDGPDGWRIYDGGRFLGEVEDAPHPPPAAAPLQLVPAAFTPPAFGMTVLGSSHGFDPAGKTTGFVLWISRRGILVDPPCDATETLAAAGVPARHVDAVILTHCHADHDAGVFQKVLEEGRVNLYTTPTILGSFLRKYVALTGESEEKLRRLFVFRPVTLGAPQRIQGAEFRFFYSLHAIPTIGFECYLGGKSFVYSSDTLYDPPVVERMHAEGILSRGRRDALLNFPWHHSLVVHEAGVPPIHTPPERLAELPAAVKQRLRLIHIAEDELPAAGGLRLARTGFDATIALPVAEPQHAEALEALDALAGIELFRDLSIERGREFLTIARRETYAAGSLIIGQGEPGDRFYIVVAGEAAVVKDGAVIKTYRHSDFFGETALLTGAPRSADVRAKSELAVLAIDKYDFLSFLRGTDLAEALVRLAQNRDTLSWDLMDENSVLQVLTAAQRTQLQVLLEPIEVAAGDALWREGGAADAAWLLESAVVEFHEGGRMAAILGRGAFVGDIDGILRGPRSFEAGAPAVGLGEQPMQLVVTKAGRAFRIMAAGLAGFLDNNPKVLLALSGSHFVE